MFFPTLAKLSAGGETANCKQLSALGCFLEYIVLVSSKTSQASKSDVEESE